jgi:HlyD family type I secretion membrane fusion protein
MGAEVAVPNRLPVLRRRSDVVGEVIGAFESDTAAVLLQETPKNQSMIIYVLAAMFTLAIVLACVVSLDRVVTSVAGIIVTSQGSLYVDPYNPSIVKEVIVKVGQVVKKGQPLATLDPTFTQANLVQMQEHMASDVATVTREQAEIATRPYKYNPEDKYESVQGGIWLKRQAQYHADLASFDGQIASVQAQMAQAVSDSQKYTTRLKLNSDIQNVYEPLLDKGYVSKLQVLTSTDATTEIARLLADAQEQIPQYRESAASLKAQRESYIHKWYADTAAQLVLDVNDLNLTKDGLDTAQKYQDLTSLNAPEDAIVLKIGKLSRGSIAAGQGSYTITPGTDPLFSLAPLSAAVEAEIDVATTDVGFIKVGYPVNLKLDTYPYVMYGLAKGVVKSISEGSFSVDQNNTPVPPYFKVRVRVTKILLHDVPANFRLIPGMTLTGDIVAGKRTIMSYLTETILQQGSETMREPE